MIIILHLISCCKLKIKKRYINSIIELYAQPPQAKKNLLTSMQGHKINVSHTILNPLTKISKLKWSSTKMSKQSCFLTKEQEETRSYISIPASPRASDAQIMPAERAVCTWNNKIGYKLNKYTKVNFNYSSSIVWDHTCGFFKMLETFNRDNLHDCYILMKILPQFFSDERWQFQIANKLIWNVRNKQEVYN